MQHRITSIGEILIDFLPIEHNGQTAGFRMHPGGSLMNVALTVARLGQNAAFASKMSRDMFGRFLRTFIEQQGIDTRFVSETDAQTTLAFVSMPHGEPEYSFYTTETADTLMTIEELPEALFSETRILHFGSISLLRGTTPAAVLATATRLRGHALLSFDPNLRPGLIQDERAYRQTLEQAFALADLIKISAMDLAWLMPDVAPEHAAADLLAHGAALVVVTLGGAGVLALRAAQAGTETLRLPPFNVAVVDTVGAGDSFSGGLLTSLADRDVLTRAALEQLPQAELEACLRYATAVSAITCTRAGADPPDRATVEQFLNEQR